MKDMGETSYVIGIKIHRDRSRGILGPSQETYINKVLERFRMKDCSPSVTPIMKGDKLSLIQCPENDLENDVGPKQFLSVKTELLVDFEPKLKWDSIIILNNISWVHILLREENNVVYSFSQIE